jgi:hypothetical protein
MDNNELTASESAILVVLMAEAKEVLNTELTARYGLDVRKPHRDKLQRLEFIASRKSGRTYALQLDDKGWRKMQDADLHFQLRGAGALSAGLAALQAALRDRVLARANCETFGELFAVTDIRAAEPRPEPADALRRRVITAYRALAEEPGSWVNLRRLRPFLADVPKDDVDDALRRLSLEADVNLVPEANQRLLTAADAEAAVRVGGQKNHLLAIGV